MRDRLFAKMAAVLALSAIVTLGLPSAAAGADGNVAAPPPADLTPGAGQTACACESESSSDVTAHPPPEQTEPTTEPTAPPDPAPAESQEAEPAVPSDSPEAEPPEGEPPALPQDSGSSPHPAPDPGGDTTAAPAVDPPVVSEPEAPSADPVVEPIPDVPVDVTTDLAVPAEATATVPGASASTSDSAAPQDDSLPAPPPAPQSPVFEPLLVVTVNGPQPSTEAVTVAPKPNQGASAAAASISAAPLDPIDAIDGEIQDQLGPSGTQPANSAFARALENSVTASMAVFVPRATTTTVSVAVEFGRVGNGWAGAIVFNVWLRRRLRERRMSQRQLAWLSGVNHSTISRLLTGDRTPSLTTATKLARALRAAHGEEDTSSYFARFTEEAAFATTRVEMALRGDDALDDDDVRGLMATYLVARARRRRGREPSATEGNKAAPALPADDEVPMLTDLPRSAGRGP